MMGPELEVCVARYNESTDWLANKEFASFSKTVYNKSSRALSAGTPSSAKVYTLPNVGRESHTFLHHIIFNYDSLADVTLFLPGSCMDEAMGKSHKTQEVVRKLLTTKESVIFGAYYENVHQQFKGFTLGTWKGTNESNQETVVAECEPAAVRPFGRWYNANFGDLKIQVVSYMSIFAVSKVHILQRPRSFYQTIYDSLSHHPNPEEGHFVERAWVAIFHAVPDRCLYAPRPLVVFNDQPVKRLDTTGKTFAQLLQMAHASGSTTDQPQKPRSSFDGGETAVVQGGNKDGYGKSNPAKRQKVG